MTKKINPEDWFTALELDLYRSDKFSTPSVLRARAGTTTDLKQKERFLRMAERRDFIHQMYLYMCKHVDDEGDCDKFNEYYMGIEDAKEHNE